MTDSIESLVRKGCREVATRFLEPKGIVFNHKGYMRAIQEDYEGRLFMSDLATRSWKTYMGLPYRIDREQEELVKVLDEVDASGGIQIKANAPSRVYRASDPVPTDYTIIGRALSKVQLCNIIEAYINGRADNPFKIELQQVVRRHGRFE